MTMKRSMVPLFGIAVVVAIISTGVFYGLFAGKLKSSSADVPGQPMVVAARDLERGAVLTAGDVRVSRIKGTLSGSFSTSDQVTGGTLLASVKANEPLLEERVVSKVPKAGGSNGGVQPGWRAVSIRISESDGLVGMLRPGARVDLQAIQDHTAGLELRPVLQNVELLSVNPQPQPGGNRGPVFIVTVLTRAEDADMLALADSGTRLRLSLRNPLDEQTVQRRSLALGSAFQSSGATSAAVPASTQKAPEAKPDGRSIQLQVQVLRASSAAATQLESKLKQPGSGDVWSVTEFSAGKEGNTLLQSLEQQHEVEVISAQHFTASPGRSARFRTGPAACQLGLEFSAEAGPGGKLNLRVKPETNVQIAGGIETHRYEAELPSSASFLVTGVLSEARDRQSLERLFPKHSWSNGRLMILVTAQAQSQGEAAVAQSQRGR